MASSLHMAAPLLCGLLFSALPADASVFLASRGMVDGVDTTHIGSSLISEIEGVLGSEHRYDLECRLDSLQKALKPMAAALPLNEHGRLGHGAVRYVLHRLFVQKHGWSVQGLEPKGEAWNASSPAEMLQNRVPEYVQQLFERRLGHTGLSLHETAVLAATLENLVHHEAVERLESVYHIHKFSEKHSATSDQVMEIIDTYMMSYIMRTNLSAIAPADLRAHQAEVKEAYPNWPETQKFVRQVRQDVLEAGQAEASFGDVEKVIEAIGDRYGRWQDLECKELKNELVALDYQGTGRVALANFYGGNLDNGKWQFTESTDYLRQLGALDESDPQHPSVIVSNYVLGPANCIAGSNFYSVCCINECEGLLGQLERKLAAPDASPAQIVELVSESLLGNRTLSAHLVRRLDEVAAHHHGRVPLHGRLFAQWLHHAYPRECPYPHVSGTTNPVHAEAWTRDTGLEPDASEEEMLQHTQTSRVQFKGLPSSGCSEDDSADGTCSLPWSMEEELVAERTEMPDVKTKVQSPAKAMLDKVMLLLLLGSFATMGFRMFQSGRTAVSEYLSTTKTYAV